MASRPLVKGALSLLNIIGVDPTRQSKRSVCKIAVALTAISLMIAEFLLTLAVQWDGFDSAELIVVSVSFVQGFYKPAAIFLKRADFLNILKAMERFYPESELDFKFWRSMKSTLAKGMSLQKIYNSIGLFTISVFLSRPLFTPGRILPFDTYHPVDRSVTAEYILMYAFQVCVTLTAFCGVFGFDLLFISLVVYVTYELRILKNRFLTIDVELYEDDEELVSRKFSQLVKHHNLVLRCIKRMNDAYEAVMLLQFSSSIIFICTGLLSLISSGFPPDMNHLSKFLMYLSCALLQLFIHCIGGTYIISETESVADAVYGSDWWAKTQPGFRRACMMVIQRANKAEYLMAGGMFAVNLINFATILQSSLSFFSLANAMNKDSK